MTEDEMVGWHHQLNGYEFEQASGDGDGQGGLVCWSPWGHKGLDTTEQLNNMACQSRVCLPAGCSPTARPFLSFQEMADTCLLTLCPTPPSSDDWISSPTEQTGEEGPICTAFPSWH